MRPELVFLRRIAGVVALLLLLVGGYAGNAEAQAWQDCTAITAGCTKEIRVYNNAGQRTLYVVWQGSIQTQPAIGCDKGDVWLQNAFNDTASCYAVNNTYLAYVNPITGIKPGEFVSIQIPWWSKTTDGGPDKAVDWWRASRIYIFDDQAALNESYLSTDPGKTPAQLAMPVISCTIGGKANNKCAPNELQIYRIAPGSSAAVQDHTPMQLNEFTIADIPGLKNCNTKPIDPNCTLNINYNVSYVDHIYLPVALGPIRPLADYGYMGTTMSRGDFQRALKTFAGCDTVALQCNGNNAAPNNLPTKWPVFNNPLVQGQSKYPLAGVKLPSPLAAFNYYMNPGFDTNKNPILLPASKDPGSWPPDQPNGAPSVPTLRQVATTWITCTTRPTPASCPQFALYVPIADAFNVNYQSYITSCSNPPDYLKQRPNSDPPTPANQFTLLRFLHGWVPFESKDCPIAKQLPLAQNPPSPPNPKGQSGAAVINYVGLQYNWKQQPPPPERLIFNPYTRFIHGTLNANAYAFSIDDAASVMKADASGLILAIGGENGLENKKQFPPPLLDWFHWYMFNIGMGAGGPGWKSYSFCGQPEQFFSPVFDKDRPPGFGFNPALFFPPISPQNPCTMKFFDMKGKPYQFVLKQAGIPQKAIWPKWDPQTSGGLHDPNVISCPDPNDNWCKFIQEHAKPGTDNPQAEPEYKLDLNSPF